MADGRNVIAGLDIGTTKVAAYIGTIRPHDIEIIGAGFSSSPGVDKGRIVNIDATVESIQSAVAEAEKISGVTIKSAYASISGSKISSGSSNGVSRIRRGEVSAKELAQALEAASIAPSEKDVSPLHVLPQEYIIDHQEGTRDPLGMSGVRLDANVHLVTCSTNGLNNIRKCIARCGINVEQIVLEPLASSYALLTDDERELGVCLIDIGGGTTSVVVYTEGAIRFTKIFSIAGDAVTTDIAMALRTAVNNAENLKIRYGCASPELIKTDDVIHVPGVNGRPSRMLDRNTLGDVIESRYRELLQMVHTELSHAGLDSSRIGSGVVLTGNAATMQGVVELAEEIFHMPVSLGVPQVVSYCQGITPTAAYSTGIGLLLYGTRSPPQETGLQSTQTPRWTHRVANWFQSYV